MMCTSDCPHTLIMLYRLLSPILSSYDLLPMCAIFRSTIAAVSFPPPIFILNLSCKMPPSFARSLEFLFTAENIQVLSN
jgi:hypothetical protein